ncbi:MAG: DUF5106 domain-containing protein, partial [Bacteroidia bacterium]
MAKESWAQKYKIKIHLENCTDSIAYLGHHFDGRVFVDDTITLAKGKGIFTQHKTLPQGIYVVYLPSKQYFDILIGKEQHFSVDAKVVDKQVEAIKISGSKESKVFQQ